MPTIRSAFPDARRARATRPTSAPSGTTPDRPLRDRGVTLVELVFSIVLSSIIGGVLVAALATSMNAAGTTSTSMASSIDSGLVAAFLTTDAQAAGGIEPGTAQVDPTLGVSTTDDTAGWAGCTQQGTLAVRFAWIDLGDPAAGRVVVTYAHTAAGEFVRRTCDGPDSSSLVLARQVRQVTATCSPGPSCSALPDRVNLRVEGGPPSTPFDVTVTADLRAQDQAAPTSANSAGVPLLLSGSPTCPTLQQSGSGGVHVLGDAVVGSGCGPSPVGGDVSELRVSGSLTLLPTVDDPLTATAEPGTCASAFWVNPAIGSADPSGTTTYPQPVTITGSVTLSPGIHVFCDGLTVAAGATLGGTDVLVYVDDGTVTVDAGATVDLSPATSGPHAGIVLWSASDLPVTLTGGATVDRYAGAVYAPRALVTVTSTNGSHVGSIVAATASFAGTGPVRIGLPIPTLVAAAGTLPAGTTAQPYSATAPAVSGGTAPYVHRATGLPPGLTMSSTGAITGTPTGFGTFTVTFVAIDATGASVVTERTLVVDGIPSAPASVTATAGDTTATITWTPVAPTAHPSPATRSPPPHRGNRHARARPARAAPRAR